MGRNRPKPAETGMPCRCAMSGGRERCARVLFARARAAPETAAKCRRAKNLGRHMLCACAAPIIARNGGHIQSLTCERVVCLACMCRADNCKKWGIHPRPNMRACRMPCVHGPRRLQPRHIDASEIWRARGFRMRATLVTAVHQGRTQSPAGARFTRLHRALAKPRTQATGCRCPQI